LLRSHNDITIAFRPAIPACIFTTFAKTLAIIFTKVVLAYSH
jgi:hypothetical protein